MPRPVSWIPRLHEIRKTVGNSVRSHFDRKDVQRTFGLQARAAGELLDMLPRITVGLAHLVKREDLQQFLERVLEADDVPALFARLREENEAVSRKRPRALVRRDFDLVYAASLGKWVTRGRVVIDFTTGQQLADILWRIASALQEDLDEFLRMYEPEGVPKRDDGAAEMRSMFAELEEMEARRA